MARPVLVLLLLAAILSGCAAGAVVEDPTSDPSVHARSLAELREAIAEVAESQADADAAVTTALDAVRAVDEAVVGARSVDTYQATLDGYATTRARVEAAAPDGLRDAFFDVAEAVDQARGMLAAARDDLDDPWEVEYLDAEDAVLVEVRAYAEAADQLAQLLQRHWPVYTAIDQELLAFSERITVERTAQEGVDALAIELDPHLQDLVVAQTQLREYRQARTEAAGRVNEATAAAVDVYASRPDESASPTPGG